MNIKWKLEIIPVEGLFAAENGHSEVDFIIF